MMRPAVALLCFPLLTAAPVALLERPAHALTYRDMRGREVTLAAPPARIVSLVPSVTELIFALGAEQRLVGRTDFCDHPPAARQKPSVGGMLAPSLETIVALKADLVLATDAGNREETVAQLVRLRIPTYIVNANRVSEVKDVIGRVGALTGRPAAVSPLIARIEQRIAAIQTAVAAFPPPRVLYVVWPEPLIVPGRDAIVTELIRLAGGHSITADFRSDYPRASLEAALAAAPEVILLASYGASAGPIPREKWQRFASLPAIKTGRLHAVHGDLLHRYGPRMVDGLEQLARALHPEAFR
jgi:iron complex transport system substrate-binding protein